MGALHVVCYRKLFEGISSCNLFLMFCCQNYDFFFVLSENFSMSFLIFIEIVTREKNPNRYNKKKNLELFI